MTAEWPDFDLETSLVPLLVQRGCDHRLVDGVRCIPAAEYLAGLRPGRRIGETP